MIQNDDLIDEIELLLLEALGNEAGGLFASEIVLGLKRRGFDVSTQKVQSLIRYRGKNIKIHTVRVGESKWLNLYQGTIPLVDIDSSN